tara:strand:+ start:1795 stop:3492 length:1698 start_codon:yes stop_codon:yes gene_type:complete
MSLLKVTTPLIITTLFVEIYSGNKEAYLASFLIIILIFLFKNIYLHNDIFLKISKFNKLNVSQYFWIFLILFLNIILQNSLLNYETITWDVPSYLVASQEIGLGYLPLETQWESKGPLLLYIYYFISELVGKNYIYFRLFNDFILFISILIIFKIVKDTSSKSTWKAVLSMLFFTLITSFEWFISEFSEIYCLIILGIIYLVFIKFENSSTKFFVIGFLFSICTLINQGTIVFAIPYFITSVYKIKYQDFKNLLFFIPGFLAPHLLFIIAYFRRGILDIYISNYFTIPLQYTSANASSFYELRVILRRFFQFDQYLYYFIIFIFLIIFYEIYKKLLSKNFRLFFDLDLLNLLFAVLFYFIAGHNYAHHLFYFLFYFAIIFNKVEKNQIVFATLLITLSSLSIFSMNYQDSYKNLRDIDATYQNYPLRILSNDILSKVGTENYEILALDYVLVLYYLDKPNVSYIIHPGNHYEDFIVKELLRLEKIQKNKFSHISYYIELEPDVVLCNPVGIISGKAEKLDFYNCSIDDYKKNYTKLDTDLIKNNSNLDYYGNPYESINVYVKNLD